MPILKEIPIRLNPEKIIKTLHLTKRNATKEEVEELIKKAESLIKAKALYKISYLTQRRGISIKIDNFTFSSRVLSKNLEKIERVFPYLITIGKNLEDFASSLKDLLKQYYFEKLGDLALGEARLYLEKHLKKRFRLSRLSSLSPGSLSDWPVTAQATLFQLLGDTERLLGVRLRESMLMIPRKSISGIFFPTEVTFSSCQLCPREGCPSRKAPYDEKLRVEYGLETD